MIALQAMQEPAAQETSVRSLGWEDPLEKGMGTYSSILAWGIPPLASRVAQGVSGPSSSCVWQRQEVNPGRLADDHYTGCPALGSGHPSINANLLRATPLTPCWGEGCCGSVLDRSSMQ